MIALAFKSSDICVHNFYINLSRMIKMSKKIKLLCTAVAMLLPVSAFAADQAIAVALGAAFKPVDITTATSFTTPNTTVSIPSQQLANGAGSITLPNGFPFYGGAIQLTTVTGEVPSQDVTVAGGTYAGSTTTTEMKLHSISVAAAAGTHAVASATANANGASGANSGSSMADNATLTAETAPAGWWGQGDSFTSQVLVKHP